MGRQRNNSQMKGKEEASESMLTEKEANQLSDTEFKAMVIRKLTELSELKGNYQKLQGNYTELTANYINMKKEIETIKKGQEEMKNTISELKNTVEEMKSRLDEAEDRISELEDKVEKKHPERARKGKEAQKEWRGNKGNAGQMKGNKNRIIRIPEGGEEEQGIENLFEK